MTGTLRFTLWILSCVAMILFVVTVSAWFYTQTDDFRTLLREQALAAVQDSVNGEVRFERISGSVWRQLHFHNVSIRQNGTEVISTPRLSLTFGLVRQAISFLFSSSLHISRIEINEPVINLRQDDSGQWNIASLLKPAAPEEPQNVAIVLRRISVSKGRIDARLAEGRLVQLTSISGEGNLALLDSGIEADVAALNFDLATEGLPPIRWRTAFSSQVSDSESALEVRELTMRTPESHFRLSGKIRDLSEPAVSLNLELNRLAASEIRLLMPEIPVQQDLSGSMKITGQTSALRVAGTLRFPDGNLLPVVVADLTPPETRLQGTVEVKNFVIEKVLSIAQIGGLLNGRISFNGTSFQNARASTRAAVSGLVVQQWKLGDLELSGDLREQRIALDTKLTSKNGKALMEGQIALTDPLSYEANLTVRKLDVQNTAKAASVSVPMTGEVNLDAWFKGRGTDPTMLDASGRVTVLPSRLGPVEDLQGKIAGSLRQGILALSEGKLASQGTTLDAEGKISVFAETPSGRVTYVVRAQEIAPWAALAGLDAKGSLNGKGSAAGSLKAIALEGKANLSNVQLAAASFQTGSAAWNVSGIGSARPKGTIKLTSREIVAGVPLRSLQADLSLAGMEPMNIQANIVAEDRENRTHRLRGQARYSSDSTDFLVEQLTLRLSIGTWRIAQPTSFQLKDNRITINDLVLQSETRSVRAQGILALEGSQDLNVQVRSFPLEELRPFLATDPRVEGVLTAEVELRGSAARPLLQGKLKVEPLTIAGQRYAGLAGEAFYKDERLTVDMILRQDASHFLTAKGGIPVYLGWGGEKSVAVLGEADLRVRSDGLRPAFLGLVSNEIENVQGNLVLDIHLRGPANALRPTGTVELQQAQGRVKQLGLVVRGVDVQARIVPDAIQITRISARSGGGRLTGGGKISLKNYSFAAINLTLNADDFRFVNTPEYVAAVSGRLIALGSQQQPFLRGSLTLTQSKLRPDLAVLRQKGPPPRDPTIVVVENEQELIETKKQAAAGKTESKRAEDSSPQNALYRRLGLDITAVVPRGTWVYLDEGSIELMGRLRIRKEPQEEVSLTGTVESVRGWYSFHGKRFEIEKGQLVFTGGSEIDPTLDVVARHKLPQHQIDLLLGGTAKKPTLALRSDPAMEQADILSTLLFGKPVAGLSEGEQTSLQARALRTTANFVASGLRQSVAKRLGVDNLEFGFGESVSEARIGVGKYITEDIYVAGAQEFGGERKQEYSVEYNLAPNWQLKGSTTPQGNSGVDLFWRKQY
ncbi:MAG: translocation/assembly module TamB domain-containing protein [Candidatus Binatia bacterium]